MGSLWLDTLGEQIIQRSALPGDREADVVVVGAGLTGLWTTYYLLRNDPSLRVVVLEQEHAGFGASGRNGGWCSALFPTSWQRLVDVGGEDGARRQHRAMVDTVAEVLRVCREERIDAQARHGGTVVVARSRAQWDRMRVEVAESFHRGLPAPDLLDAHEASERLRATGVVGGTWTPDCAAVHPLRLVRGLAEVVEAAGATVHEGTHVLAVEQGRVRTEHGVVHAPVVVRATEGWTARLPGLRRAVVPVYSLIVATEPLGTDVWAELGLRERETFSDGRHVIVYGQRTADGRMVFGGRGAPYHWGSGIRPSYDEEPRVFAALRRTVHELFPRLRGVRFTHAWGGPLGIARDWAASVSFDPATGLAHAGGYVGDGLSTTNLAGRTLADLILKNDTDLTSLPWVDHHSRPWEPEPLRWLGVNAGLLAMRAADAEERLRDRPSLVARAMAPLIHG